MKKEQLIILEALKVVISSTCVRDSYANYTKAEFCILHAKLFKQWSHIK